MESKDEEIVRFSDLIKKGAVKKPSPEEKEVPSEIEKTDDGPLRFSDLGALRLKSRVPVRPGAPPMESAIRPERETGGERTSTPIPDADPDEFEKYKRLRSRTILEASGGASVTESGPDQVKKEKTSLFSERTVAVGKEDGKPADLKGEDTVPVIEEKLKETEPEGAAAISQQPVDVAELYDEVRYCLEGIKGKIIAGQRFDIQPARNVIGKMIESRQRIENLYPLTTRAVDEEDYNVSHQTNVAIYALKLGFGLGYSGEKLLELGLCSLLHDAGMFRIPDGIKLKRERLTGQEVDIIQTHPEIGRDILNVFKGSYPALSIVAHEHHEREGGQGYPRGLKGNDIHELARIVAITDSYEAMTHHRPYRRALLQPLSAKELIKQRNALFAPFVIKVFLQEISLYPPGSYVLLNNKAVAEVVTNDRNHPLRPDVRIVYDGEGNRVEGQVIVKLAQNPLFFIVDGILQDDLPRAKSK